MAKAQRRAFAKLERRRRAFDALSTSAKQGRKLPGSLNRRKGA